MASPLRPPVIDRLNWARGAEAQEQIHRDTYVELYVYIYICVCVCARVGVNIPIYISCVYIYIYVYTFNSISIHMQHLYTRHRKVKTVQVYLNSRNKPYLDV